MSPPFAFPRPLIPGYKDIVGLDMSTFLSKLLANLR